MIIITKYIVQYKMTIGNERTKRGNSDKKKIILGFTSKNNFYLDGIFRHLSKPRPGISVDWIQSIESTIEYVKMFQIN